MPIDRAATLEQARRQTRGLDRTSPDAVASSSGARPLFSPVTRLSLLKVALPPAEPTESGVRGLLGAVGCKPGPQHSSSTIAVGSLCSSHVYAKKLLTCVSYLRMG